jgi:hypothetical protein
MTRDTGIRSLLLPVVDPDDERMQAEAKAAVMQRLNITDTPTTLPAAVDRLTDLSNSIIFKPSFYEPTIKKKEEIKKEKFDRYMDKEYGHEAIKKHVLKEVYQNKKAGRAPYENMSTSSIIVAETVKDAAKAEIAKLKGPPKNKKILPIEVDPSHPDGFYFKDDKDVYDVYKDNPVRYIEEISRKYEGTPINSAVKEYDHLNKDTYPSNQQAALASYGKAYDRLTSMQKKQVENGKKKLFQNILPLKK